MQISQEERHGGQCPGESLQGASRYLLAVESWSVLTFPDNEV